MFTRSVLSIHPPPGSKTWIMTYACRKYPSNEFGSFEVVISAPFCRHVSVRVRGDVTGVLWPGHRVQSVADRRRDRSPPGRPRRSEVWARSRGNRWIVVARNAAKDDAKNNHDHTDGVGQEKRDSCLSVRVHCSTAVPAVLAFHHSGLDIFTNRVRRRIFSGRDEMEIIRKINYGFFFL